MKRAFQNRIPEFLITGRACVPGSDPQPACAVTARLGEIQKSLYVFGDREWRGDRFTDPVPFTDMPLDWSHAYGGEGYAANPLGKGAVPVEAEGRRFHPLPNIEYPSQTLTAPTQRPQPAGFAPIDQMWPQRSSMVGTYDQAWLEQDFPGFANDMDLRFFNLTAQDQHLPRALRGDEPFALENLHPDIPMIQGQLPGLVARCYVDRSTGDGVAPEEVPTALKTVWFFPHADRMILVYQGATMIAEEDGADITRMMIGAERLGEPKGDDHYRRVIAERLDKEKGHLLALRDFGFASRGNGGSWRKRDGDRTPVGRRRPS